MGQYYVIADLDKRQFLWPFDHDSGLKLMEWSYDLSPMVLDLMALLSDEWKGDRVYVVGDYADLSEADLPFCTALWEALDRLGLPADASLYDYVRENFKSVLPTRGSLAKGRKCRYIYDHAGKRYIDLDHCPIERIWYDGKTRKIETIRIAPLPLLLAMGNGRGGDYHERFPGYDLVGSWCDTVTSIEVTRSKLKTAKDYTEFAPDFTENEYKIAWTEEEAFIESILRQAVDRSAGTYLKGKKIYGL